MNWWELGEWTGFQGEKLATYKIACAFCGEKGNFETVQHLERVKPGGSRKTFNYDTLKCGHCGNYMFAFWSAAAAEGAFTAIARCHGTEARQTIQTTGQKMPDGTGSKPGEA